MVAQLVNHIVEAKVPLRVDTDYSLHSAIILRSVNTLILDSLFLTSVDIVRELIKDGIEYLLREYGDPRLGVHERY
jgi:hypothetical protein